MLNMVRDASAEGLSSIGLESIGSSSHVGRLGSAAGSRIGEGTLLVLCWDGVGLGSRGSGGWRGRAVRLLTIGLPRNLG